MLRKRKGLFLLVGAVVALIFSATVVLGKVKKEEAIADSGSVTYYQQYTNGTTTVGNFKVNGTDAWCAEHDRTSLPYGTAVSTLSGYPKQITDSSSEADKLMYKIMYYGVQGGYGIIPITMGVSYVYTNGRSPVAFGGSHHDTGNSLTAQQLYDYASSASLPQGTKTLYLWSAGGTYQVLSQYGYEANQTVTVTKVWKDNSNAYGTRPTTVRFHFYVDGSYVGNYDLTGSGNTWTQDMSLPVGVVSISEDTPSGYSSSVNGLTITNTLSDTTSITATKVWSDYGNADSSRPSSVSIQLLRNGSVIDTASVTGTGDTWTKTWSDLDKYDANGAEYTYSVNEATVPTGYSKTQSGNTITNTYTTTTSVSVTKQWRDNSNAYTTRPSSIEIEILQNGSVFQTKTLTGTGNSWSATYTGLPKYDASNNAYIYTVREKTTPTGYTMTQNGNTITNTLTDTTSITVTKNWSDYNNADNTRPSSVSIQLLCNGSVIDTASVTGTGDTWTKTWSDLDKYDANGVEYTYSVNEATVPAGYSKTQSGNTITNTYTTSTSTTITKVWDDWSNRHSTRPASIQMQLLRNGTVFKTVTITGSDNTWTYTESGLEKYDASGNAYTYTWNEPAVPANYTKTQSGNTITNKLTTKVSTTITKIWKDNSNAYNTRPTSILFQLLRNGTVVETATVTGTGDTWTKTWSDLDKYDANGVEYTYSVNEATVPTGYSKSQSGNTITNTLTDTTEVTMRKVWVDNSNKYNTRPVSVSFEILRNGTVIRTETLDGSGNTWEKTVTDLPKYDSEGVEYVYTVREASAPTNYVVTQSGNTVTNTLSVLMAVRGRKTWKDNSDAYNLRPDSITLRLYKTRDGETERTQVTATPIWTKNGNSWEYVFSDLPMYEGGVKLTYTVNEVVPDNYKNEQDDYDFINTLFGKVEVSGTKTWRYNNAPERARPAEITVVLLRNGEVYQEQIVTADEVDEADGDAEDTELANEAVWHFTFTDLDKYDANGVLYEYSIQELEVEFYDTEIDETDITNTYNPELIEIHVDKVWLNDTEDERPGEIEVQLLRDGEVYEETVLDNETGWEYTWYDLDPNYDYMVKETYRIPGYYEGVTKGDVEHGFTIENKKIPDNPHTADIVGIAVAALAVSAGTGAVIAARRRR